MGKLVVKEIKNGSDRDKQKIDDFILNNETNVKFINSLNYFAYYSVAGRFTYKSPFLIDEGSGDIHGGSWWLKIQTIQELLFHIRKQHLHELLLIESYPQKGWKRLRIS